MMNFICPSLSLLEFFCFLKAAVLFATMNKVASSAHYGVSLFIPFSILFMKMLRHHHGSSWLPIWHLWLSEKWSLCFMLLFSKNVRTFTIVLCLSLLRVFILWSYETPFGISSGWYADLVYHCTCSLLQKTPIIWKVMFLFTRTVLNLPNVLYSDVH